MGSNGVEPLSPGLQPGAHTDELTSQITNTTELSPYPPQIQSYSATVTISLSTSERPNASYRAFPPFVWAQVATYTPVGLITHKFHGSFRMFSYPLKFSSKLPYRYSHEFLVLYPNFSGSRQIGLLVFPVSP